MRKWTKAELLGVVPGLVGICRDETGADTTLGSVETTAAATAPTESQYEPVELAAAARSRDGSIVLVPIAAWEC
jgi:hypothetical protein